VSSVNCMALSPADSVEEHAHMDIRQASLALDASKVEGSVSILISRAAHSSLISPGVCKIEDLHASMGALALNGPSIAARPAYHRAKPVS
jgi:hypothetical protein